jgi:hypothetical protein
MGANGGNLVLPPCVLTSFVSDRKQKYLFPRKTLTPGFFGS